MVLSRSKCASNLLLFAVAFALFVGGAALNNIGFNYSGVGVSSGLKIHPYSMLTFLCGALFFARFRANINLVAKKKFIISVGCALVASAIIITKSIGYDRQSFGFAVDTLFSAMLVAFVLPFLNGRFARRIWTMGLVFVFTECLLAIFEVVARINLIPIDTWYGGHFRATALHGHPLNNALVLVTVSSSLQLSARGKVSACIFLLTTAALSAFGARGALAVYLTLNAILFIRFGLRSAGRMAIVLFGMPAAVCILSYALLSGVLGDRIANVGAFDDSSDVRLQSIQMLRRIDWLQMLVGIEPEAVSRIMGQAKVSVVENFLVAYVFMFGLVCVLLLFICLLMCASRLCGESNHGDRRVVYAIFLMFIATALTNNSLVTKTPALYLCFVFAWSAAQMHEYCERGHRKAWSFRRRQWFREAPVK